MRRGEDLTGDAHSGDGSGSCVDEGARARGVAGAGGTVVGCGEDEDRGAAARDERNYGFTVGEGGIWVSDSISILYMTQTTQ